MAANSKPLLGGTSAPAGDFAFTFKINPLERGSSPETTTPDRKRQPIFSLANTTFISNSSDSLGFGVRSQQPVPSQTPKPSTPARQFGSPQVRGVLTPVQPSGPSQARKASTPAPAVATATLTKEMAALKMLQTQPQLQTQRKPSPSPVAASPSPSASLSDKTSPSSGSSGSSEDESSSEEESVEVARRTEPARPATVVAQSRISPPNGSRQAVPISPRPQSRPPAQKSQTAPPRRSEALPARKVARKLDPPAKEMTPEAEAALRASHMQLLEHHPGLDELNEIKTTPIFTEAVRKYAQGIPGSETAKPFSQYGLLAGDITGLRDQDVDKRVFWNIAAPSSFFICGSQGSGKSHTLSCLLENSLAPCAANVLPNPLTGIVFHYDTFISDTGGSPCEAAWLSSNENIKVRVLCPPTNISTMRRMYSKFPHIVVEELRLNEADLNTRRMLDLMAVTSAGMPLYLHVVNRILRELRVSQQHHGGNFDYTKFKQMLAMEDLTEMQLAPLKQRLDTLESFMVEQQAKAFDMFTRRGVNTTTPKTKGGQAQIGTDWRPRGGALTIVDLSCPCVTAEMACSLFNICLSLFLEQPSDQVGRIVALDEAHKYMNGSPECHTLTEALLATIRLQRHLGARVIISTQEPTISPKLLDLCSVTVVHRFTSPDWLNALRKHLAGVSSGARLLERAQKLNGDAEKEGDVEGIGSLSLGEKDPSMELFSQIVALRVGEALLFAPSAVIGVKKGHESGRDVKRLAHGVMKVRVRNRTTADGGRSIMAS